MVQIAANRYELHRPIPGAALYKAIVMKNQKNCTSLIDVAEDMMVARGC